MSNRIIVFIIVTCAFGSEFYVAKHGDDSNPGTIDSPFLTIQQASDTMVAGDICYIRKGLYHENVIMDDNGGTDGLPIVFTNYNNERVAMDGTIPIGPNWQVHSGDIWKTTLDHDIWQLFVDWNEMVMARWPNANFEDGSIWNKEDHWGHGTIDEDSESYENGTLIDAPHGEVDLAGSGLDVTDAIAILNVGSFKTWTRRVLTHSGNTFTYDSVPGWKTKHHDYFFEGMLTFLDAEGEWFFDIETKVLYFWVPNGADPNGLHIRGKVQSYAFDVSNSDHVQLIGLEFFGTTFKFENCDNVLVEGCNLYYPSCYKRMLGVVDTQPEMSIISSSSNCVVSNSAFRYTDGSALEMYSGSNKIEECYFYHIDYTSTDLNGLMTTIQMGGSGNIFRRNTLHKLGASATLNPGNEALIELNDMSDSGHMQSDGALIQCMVGQQPGVEIRYNWLHDTIKYGARFDGNGDGNNGLMHHNVIWNVVGGIMAKGFEHALYNNTAFDNGDKNDIIIMIEQGGNEGTITRNNAANKIAGHRTGTYQDYPVPGTYDHNWNGYETGGDVKGLLLDPENYDFRPHPDSSLVDAGIVVEGITNDYTGGAPDLGAYENGGEFWVPGITWDVSLTFGDDFNPPEPLNNGPVWYITNSGSDDNDGSEEYPFATIQAGIDASNDGDTVLVAAGTYVENIVWSANTNIHLIGSGADSTIIDGDFNDCVIKNNEGSGIPSEIRGFTIQNGLTSFSGGGIEIDMVGDLLLKDLIIKNNTAGNGGGVSIEGLGGSSMIGTHITVENVVFSGNHANGNGGGYHLEEDFISTLLRDVTFANNSAGGSGGGISIPGMGDYAVVANSIFWNNSPNDVDGMVIPFYSNINGGVEGHDNISINPNFVDSTNFNLQEESPCIDAGNAQIVINLSSLMLPGEMWMGDTIVDLTPEFYNGTAPDMGAYESPYTTSLAMSDVLLPLNFRLYFTYPNPFNPVTTLRYDLPKNSLVNITIYDMMGRVVKTIVNDQQMAGYRSIQWNATNNNGSPVSAGMYLYMIQAGEFRQTKKMILLK